MGAVDSFQFDPEDHVYTLGGIILPSVTQVLDPIKPDYSMVPPAVLERKRQLGNAVHAACELDDMGELDDSETDPEIMGYVLGWREFLRNTGCKVIENERQLYHPSLFYAGTLDRALVFVDETWIVDIKTVAPSPMPSFGVQIAGYDLLRQAHGAAPADKRASVHLLADGTYRMKTYKNPNDYACFRALLSVAHWKKENQK